MCGALGQGAEGLECSHNSCSIGQGRGGRKSTAERRHPQTHSYSCPDTSKNRAEQINATTAQDVHDKKARSITNNEITTKKGFLNTPSQGGTKQKTQPPLSLIFE